MQQEWKRVGLRELSKFLTGTPTERRNWLGVMFGALLYMAQRPGH